MTVPPEAAEAAAKVVMRGGSIADALEAAEPLMVAAERERIRQMAIKHKATYPFYSEPGFITDHPSFADLIGETP